MRRTPTRARQVLTDAGYPKRDGVSFSQRRRLEQLRDLLAEHAEGLSLKELSARLDLTIRTLRRYLKELDRDYELSCVQPKQGGARLWRIAPSELPRKVEMRRTQAYALVAARRLYTPLKGAALFDELELAFSRLRALAQRPGRGPNAGLVGARLAERFVFAPSLARDFSDWAEEFDELFLAVSELRPVDARWTNSGEERRVRMHPYALVLRGDAVLVVAHCPAEGWTQSLPLESLRDCVAGSEERFSLPEDLDLEAYLECRPGQGSSLPPAEVVLDFEVDQVAYVRTLALDASQQLSRSPTGGVRLLLEHPHPHRLVPWLMSLGSSVRVVQPRALADQLRAEAARVLQSYESSSR